MAPGDDNDGEHSTCCLTCKEKKRKRTVSKLHVHQSNSNTLPQTACWWPSISVLGQGSQPLRNIIHPPPFPSNPPSWGGFGIANWQILTATILYVDYLGRTLFFLESEGGMTFWHMVKRMHGAKKKKNTTGWEPLGQVMLIAWATVFPLSGSECYPGLKALAYDHFFWHWFSALSLRFCCCCCCKHKLYQINH